MGTTEDKRTLCMSEEGCENLKGAYCEGGNPDCAFAEHNQEKSKVQLTEPVDLVEVVPEVKRTVTEMGTASTFKVRKWEIVDFSLVPNELKIIDAGKVTKLVKAGIGSIAGIRIYEEDSLRVTTQ